VQKKNDALALLKQDHEKVAQLFKQAEKDEDIQEEIFSEIKSALTVHATIEEEIFYPAVKKAKSEQTKDEVLEALAEHKQIKALLAELSNMSGDDDSFGPKLKVLKEDVEHHVEEEQDDMFPDAKKYLGEKRLAELGLQLEKRKQELMDEMETGIEGSEEVDESKSKTRKSSSSQAGQRSKSR
jgi:hemerythrin superfamily protein